MSFEKKSVFKSTTTTPLLINQAKILADLLKSMNTNEIRLIMQVSPAIAEGTLDRFIQWKSKHSISNATPAMLTFSGNVYDGLNAGDFCEKDFSFAQKHVLILSGLYGVLRALDLMMLYRLEMGIKWTSDKFLNLYEYWKQPVNDVVSEIIKTMNAQVILNLASNEYFKIIDIKKQKLQIISPQFMELKGSQMKMVSIYAKKARGMMARFVIKNQIINPEELLLFNEEGYEYIESSTDKPVFVR